jgi:hypothetical protein
VAVAVEDVMHQVLLVQEVQEVVVQVLILLL